MKYLLLICTLLAASCVGNPDPDADLRLAECLRTLPDRIHAQRVADEARWRYPPVDAPPPLDDATVAEITDANSWRQMTEAEHIKFREWIPTPPPPDFAVDRTGQVWKWEINDRGEVRYIQERPYGRFEAVPFKH